MVNSQVLKRHIVYKSGTGTCYHNDGMSISAFKLQYTVRLSLVLLCYLGLTASSGEWKKKPGYLIQRCLQVVNTNSSASQSWKWQLIGMS